MTRKEEAESKKTLLDEVSKEILGYAQAGNWKSTKRAVEKAITLEYDIKRLLQFESAEEERLALVRIMENGYH